MYTVSKLKDGIEGILTGLNLDNVDDLNGKLQRAARTLVQKADILEASGKLALTLYDRVYDYGLSAAPIFGGVVYDLRPQGRDRQESDYVYKQYIEQFDRTKAVLPNGVQMTFEYNKGTPIVRVASARATAATVLDSMSDTSGWVGAGSISTVAQDKTDYYEAPASLRFSPAGASVATLTKTVGSASIADYEDVAVGFLAFKVPSTTNLTSIAVRVGSSSSAYDTVSTTTGFLGAWTSGDWIIAAFDFSGATSTGTPNWSAISYLQVRVTHAGAITNMRVGGFWLALPTPYNLLYGSSALFMASGADPSNTITDNNDSILLNDAAFTLLEWEGAKEIAIGQGGTLSSGQVQMIETRLEKELYPMYKADNPSQEIRTVGSWYDD